VGSFRNAHLSAFNPNTLMLPNSHHIRLFQVEYAIEAVKLGSTAVGIQTSEGIILAVEKRLTSTLLEPSSVEKIMEVDFHIGAAVSGLIGGY
jgi:20S proteasome alpha/beta subunit